MTQFIRARAAFAFALTLSAIARADTTDDYVRAQMQAQHIPGLSIAVIRDGKLELAKGYGYANLELRAPATADTVYELASVTKQFIAAAVLLLQQDGELSLDDSVGKFLDIAPPAWKDVTLRHLLSMTSGVKDYISDSLAPGEKPLVETRTFPKEDSSADKIINSIAALPLKFPPGEQFSYSNTGYIVLARVVTRVAGQEWDQFLDARVFKPLGMTQTRRNDDRQIFPNRASRYDIDDDAAAPQWRNSMWLNPTYWWQGGAGIVSTVRDMAKWDAALREGRILNADSQRLLRTPQTLKDGSQTHYGMGWWIDPFNGHTRMAHSGGVSGGGSNFTRFDDGKVSLIVIANTMVDLAEIANDVAGFFEPKLAHPSFILVATASPPAAGKLITITVSATNWGAPTDGLVNLDIRKAPFDRDDVVSHQASPIRKFATGKAAENTFTWTAPEAGEYRVYVGAFSKDWAQMYAWKNGAATVNVQ
jgi:CubicO group peptidase (beta-lactamase class C family)